MMQLLQELERKLATLPEAKREQWVSHFLEELAAEDAHDIEEKSATGRKWIGGRKPSQKKIEEAIEHLQQFRKGKTLGDDVTLKDLINEGRTI